MEKNLYYSLSDNSDISGLIMDLPGCMEHIKADALSMEPADILQTEYSLNPVYMTAEEFANLPEYQY